MDAQPNVSFGSRRNEDIALDLLKFVAATAGVGRPAAPSTGFSGAAAAKPDEHVNQLLSLYGRCLKAIEGEATDAIQAGQRPEPTQAGLRPEPPQAPEEAIRAPQEWMPRP